VRRQAAFLVCLGVLAGAILLGHEARWGRLQDVPPGTVLTVDELASYMPRAEVVRGTWDTPHLPLLVATAQPASEPAWMVVSNTPEYVFTPDFAGRDTAVLCREQVPAGSGRVFVSHFNSSGMSRQVLVSYRNMDAQRPAHLVFSKSASIASGKLSAGLDAGTELWRAYEVSDGAVAIAIAPSGSYVQTSDVLQGLGQNGLLMSDVQCDVPLEVTVAMSSAWRPPDSDLPALARRSTQSRGLYLQPDRTIETDFVLDRGVPQRWSYDGPWLSGSDASLGTPVSDTLNGNYGAIVHFQVHVHRRAESAFKRVALLLVPRGGPASAVVDGHGVLVPTQAGAVLCNQPVDVDATLRFEFSLAANNWAPVHLVCVPLR
jgi:hypothetical protein